MLIFLVYSIYMKGVYIHWKNFSVQEKIHYTCGSCMLVFLDTKTKESALSPLSEGSTGTCCLCLLASSSQPLH